MTPPSSETQLQFQQQQHRFQSVKPSPQGLPGNPGLGGATGGIGAPLGPKGGSSGAVGTGGTPAAYFQSNTFLNHIEQLGKLTRPLSFLLNRAMFVLD